MRRRTLKNNSKEIKARLIQHVDTMLGDFVFYDSSSDSMLYYRFDDGGEDIIPDTCTPIGAVAIPYEFSEYFDKACGVVALENLGYTVWGNTNSFITENITTKPYAGKEKTQAIIDYRGAKPEGWTPDVNNPDDFPAASLCNLYSTIGTNQGDWFLPSTDEFMACSVIYNALFDYKSEEFIKYYGDYEISSIPWSCDEVNSNDAMSLGMSYYGYTWGIFHTSKTSYCDVNPFIKIGGIKTNYGDIVISGGTVNDIPVSGGSSQVSGYTYSQTYGYGDSTTNGGTITSGAEINVTSVSGDNLGTTEKERTKIGESVLTITMNGKTATMSYDVYQQANELIENTLRIYGGSRSDTQPANTNDDWMVASGGTYYYTAINRRTYTSGAELEEDVSSQTTATLGNWNGSYTYGSISGINVVIPSRGTDTGSERYQEVNFSYNGLTARRQQGQQANSRWETSRSGGTYSYGNVSAGSISNGWIGAGGGTGTGYAGNGSQYWYKSATTAYYSYTSNSSSSSVIENASDGYQTISPSRSNYSVSVGSRGTTPGDVLTWSASVYWYGSGGKTASGTIYVQQAANRVEKTVYNTPVINFSYPVSSSAKSYINPSFSATQNATDTYTSGSPNTYQVASWNSHNTTNVGFSVISGLATVDSYGVLTWPVNNNTTSRTTKVRATLYSQINGVTVTKDAVSTQNGILRLMFTSNLGQELEINVKHNNSVLTNIYFPSSTTQQEVYLHVDGVQEIILECNDSNNNNIMGYDVILKKNSTGATSYVGRNNNPGMQYTCNIPASAYKIYDTVQFVRVY